MVDQVTVELKMDNDMQKKMHTICGLLKELDNSKTREGATKVAKLVFDHMDLNHNGKLERKELLEDFRRIEVYEKMQMKTLFVTMTKEAQAEKLKEYEEEVKAGVVWFLNWYD